MDVDHKPMRLEGSPTTHLASLANLQRRKRALALGQHSAFYSRTVSNWEAASRLVKNGPAEKRRAASVEKINRHFAIVDSFDGVGWGERIQDYLSLWT
jgi:hypothetical protein